MEASEKKKRKASKKQKRVEDLMAGMLGELKIPHGFGLTWRGVRSEEAKGRISDAPFWVAHEITDENGTGRALVVAGISTDQRVVFAEIPFTQIHGGAGQLAARLSSVGLRIRSGGAQETARYINSFSATPMLVRVRQPGWIGDPRQKLVFALRDRVINGQGYDLRGLQEMRELAGLESRGTLAVWREHVARPAAGHPVAAFSIMLPLASVLLELLDAEGFGALLRGSSSIGKTTVLMMAASVFGRAILGPDSMVSTFNGTINALEPCCASRNSIGMLLDEVGMFDGPAFTTFAYRVARGVSKGRLGRDGNLREISTWRFAFLCTGERSVEEVLAEDHRVGRARAGQLVRLLNLESGDKIFVCDSAEEAKALVHDLRMSVSRFFGTAGPAFVQRLIENLEDPDQDAFTVENLREEWDRITERLLLPSMEVHQQRAVRHLALVALAGVVACMLDVLPFDKTDVVEHVREVRDMYLAGGAASDATRAARRLRDYIIENADYFADINSARQQGRRHAGDSWKPFDVRFYLFTKKGLCTAAGVTEPGDLLRYLKKYGLLHQNNGDKLQSRVPVHRDQEDSYRTEHRQMGMYCISEHLMAWRDDQPYPTKEALAPEPRKQPKPLVRRREQEGYED